MRVFNKKLTFDKLVDTVSYYNTCRGAREQKGKKKYGTYFYLSKYDKKELSQYDNVIFLTGHSEYAPERKKEIIFIFD